MHDFALIELAIRDRLTALRDAHDEPIFRSVEGNAAPDRAGILAAAARATPPAVIVQVAQRAKDDGLPGPAQALVFLIQEGLRTLDAPRLGDVSVISVLELAKLIATDLDGAHLPSNWRLVGETDRVFAMDAHRIVLQLQYVALAEPPELPTYDNQALAGPDAIVHVECAAATIVHKAFAFPGVDGRFIRRSGPAPRTITWSGWLRSPSASAARARESAIAAVVRAGRVADVTNGWGDVFSGCVPTAWRTIGPRRIHPVTRVIVQPFELTFTQPVW